MPSPLPFARSSQRSESGSQTWYGVFPPTATVLATLYESAATTSTSMHRPSVRTSSARARSATARTAGAMSGEAATVSRTASLPQGSENERRPVRATAAVPAVTTTTSAVARTTVRRRFGAEASPGLPAGERSGKL